MKEVAAKAVRLMCGNIAHDVVGLVSSAAQVSSMSERLANKLHIGKQSAIKVGNMAYDFTGYLPDRAINVSCAVNRKHNEGILDHAHAGFDKIAVPVAFVIMPSPFNELVLGNDWLHSASQKLGGSVIMSSEAPPPSPDHCFMHIGGGHPTPGPGYVDGAVSFGHVLNISEQDHAKLQELVEQAVHSE